MPEETEQKKPRGKPFTGRDDPRRAADGGKAARQRKAAPVVLESRSDGLLSAMRWVTSHGPNEDQTWEQKSAREWKETSPATFYNRMAALEEAGQTRATPSQTSGGGSWDGESRCPTCNRFPGQADPEDPITPEMSDDEADERTEAEWKRIVELLASNPPWDRLTVMGVTDVADVR